MSLPNRERVKELLSRAARLPAQDRKAFIQDACAADQQTAAEAIDLLATLDDPGFMSAPTGVGLAAALPGAFPSMESPGTRIDRYKLLQLIGEGGFGSVYMAEQIEPVQRRVALKIIKAGMDTRQVIARFEAERQALAMMDHPNIARVLDAGATQAGRPYFVMELVRGEPVTGYCDRERLPVRQRLELFRDVCNAVQHAHQKGIIHRDLKPSNVLVTVADGSPLPKVIDFGIAKATAGRLTDRTLFTEMHQLIGTPEYMSPEQAEVSGVDIDTRSDIYSLGVLLYELLAGSTPLEQERLRSTPLAEIQRLIREVEAPRPSLRFATLASSSAGHGRTPFQTESNSSTSAAIEIAKRRRSEPLQLTRALRGDLDWMVMKCLEKDRTRRYATAVALAEDIGRYLSDQPVLAMPPSRAYSLRKFVHRNSRTVIAAAAITTTLLIATAVSLTFGLSEARQHAAAELARTRAEKAEDEAEARAAELEQVAKFQQEQLSGIDVQTMGVNLRADLLTKARVAAERSELPPEAVDARIAQLEALIVGSDFTSLALQSLEKNFFQPTLAAIDQQFAGQPLVKARLLETLVNTLHEMGLFEASIAPQEEALAIRRSVLGADHPDTLSSISNMGFLFYALGNLEEAERFVREALDAERRVLGDEHPQTVISISNLGLLKQAQGKLVEAEQFNREALDIRRRVLGDEHADTLVSMNNMGFLLQAQGKLSEAEPYFREALAKNRRVLGDEDPKTLVCINNMGGLLYAQGMLTEAEPYFLEAVEVSRQVLGGEHHDTLRAMDNMAVVLRAQGRFAESEIFCRESVQKHRHTLGDEHVDTLISIGNLGVLLLAQGRLAEAETYLQEALDASRRTLGPEHPVTLRALLNWGHFLQSTEKLSDAEQVIRDVLDRRRRLLGQDHPDTLLATSNLCALLLVQDNVAEAEPYCRAAMEESRRLLGETHASTLIAISNMADLFQAQGHSAHALAILVPSEASARQAFTAGNLVRLGRFLSTLGRVRSAIGEYASSELNLTEAHAIFSEAIGTTDRDRIDVVTGLLDLYESWHTAAPNQGHETKAAEWRTQLRGIPPVP